MTQIAIPTKRSTRSYPMWAYALAAIVVIAFLVMLAVYAGKFFNSGTSGATALKTVPVKYGTFESHVVVKGDLQAVDNIDIVCMVEGSNAITQLVPEGSFVSKGDVLVVLDSSTIRQKLEDSLIEWQRSKADLTTAEEMLEIQKSQNAANLEAAQVALQLANIDMVKYTEGEYPGLLADAEMSVEKAETGLKTKLDDLAQTRSLFSKGFVTATEVKNKELEVAAATRDVTKAKSDMELLVKYTHQADLAAKKNTQAQAEQKLNRTKRENSANLSQKEADLQAKAQQLELIERRVARYREQVEACTIIAPADGLVVYRNDNNRDSVQIQEGANVRERQVLMRLPDTARMKVVLKINENQINGLAVDQQATVRLSSSPMPIPGHVTKISPVADSGDRWMNPDRRDYPVDVILSRTPKGLKPGMSAQVSILTEQIEDAIFIPVGALYSAGADRYVFLAQGDKITPIKVQMGKSNDQEVQLIDGPKSGDQVLMLEAGQGKMLLEQAGIKVTEVPANAEPGRRRRNNGSGASTPGGNETPRPNGDTPRPGVETPRPGGTETPRPTGSDSPKQPADSPKPAPSTPAPAAG